MAFTEKYVTTGGSAINGGTNDSTDAWDFVTGWTSVAAGQRLNIKAGTYTLNSGIAHNAGNGTAANPIHIRGYTTTAGDISFSRDSNGDLVTSSMPYLSCGSQTQLGVGAYTTVEGLNIVGNRTNQLVQINSSYSAVYNCYIRNACTSASWYSTALSFDSCWNGNCVCCDLYNAGAGTPVGYAVSFAAGGTLYGCKCSAPLTKAVYVISNFCIVDSIIYNSAVGVYVDATNTASTHTIANCTFYGCSTAAIQSYNGGNMQSVNLAVLNNHITDCGNALDNLYANPCPNTFVGNRTRDNTAANTNTGIWPVLAPMVTDNGGAESDYRNVSANDFGLARRAVARGASQVLPNRDVGAWGAYRYRSISGKQAERDYGFKTG